MAQWKEVNFKTANRYYNAGGYVRIGSSPDNCWSINNKFEEGKSLEYVVNRYKQYNDGEIKFFVNPSFWAKLCTTL